MRSDWRDKFASLDDEDTQAVPMVQSVLVRYTGWGAKFLADHAKRRGMSRTAWIRMACAEQLAREGVAEPPQLSPYHGTRLVREVEHGY